MALCRAFIFLALLSAIGAPSPASAREGFIQKLIEKRQVAKNGQDTDATGLNVKGENYQGRKTNESFEGRNFAIYTPTHLPPVGQRAMIVVLHGGMGNAVQIQGYLGLDALADKFGFVVAYLNGTKVMRVGTDNMRGWNAGECCGLPQKNNTDDVGYISGTVKYLSNKYGIDQSRVYGMGHSNGAMMTQRLVCETNLYAAAVSVSGTLENNAALCPSARGKRILAIHGAEDKNVPIEGGYGSEAVNKNTNYKSQAYSKSVFEKSGATYELDIVKEATHNPETINAALIKYEGVTLPQKLVSYLGLDK